MELRSVILARSVQLFELDALNPFGRYTAAEAFATLRERYSFAQSPKELQDITNDKPGDFRSGRLGDIAIDRLQLYPNGILVDTRSSTKDAETVGDDIVDMAHRLLGSRVAVNRKHYVSQVTFASKLRLDRLNPVLAEVAKYIEDTLSETLKQGFIAETSCVSVTIDNTQARIVPAKFTIERRADEPFVDNIYFSSAPFSSDAHIGFLEKFEASLL